VQSAQEVAARHENQQIEPRATKTSRLSLCICSRL